MSFKFCPECGAKLNGAYKFCPECGFKFNAPPAQASPADTAAGELFDLAQIERGLDKQLEKSAEYESKVTKIRAFCIRGNYEEAKRLCDELLDADPADMNAYMGLIRVASENYTAYEGEELEKTIREAKQISRREDLRAFDEDYADYTARREQFFIERDFNITGSILNKYKGAGGAVIIPDCVQIIGANAFKNCRKITSVTIPNSVTSIGEGAFASCVKLASVTIPSGVTSIEKSTFFYCESLTSVTIPDGVTNIGENAFESCHSLTSVTIPDSVKVIGKGAFNSCYNLANVTIPNGVTSIEENAFIFCYSLTSVVIPDSVTSIGKCAFVQCNKLTSAIIGANCRLEGSIFPDNCKVTRR